MSNKEEGQPQDSLFADQLKDQFAFFYAVTIVAIEAYKKARDHYQKQSKNQ